MPRQAAWAANSRSTSGLTSTKRVILNLVWAILVRRNEHGTKLRRPIASPARRGTRAHGTRPVLADPARGAVPTVRGVTRITRRPSGPERRRRREHSADALEAFRKLRVVAGGL